MALIFVISSFEVHFPGVEHVPLRDKGVHFIEYGVLGGLCAAASSRSWPSASVWRTAAFAILVSVLWGLSDEIHQAFVPGRSSEIADFVADVVGSVAGVVGWHLFSNRTVS